jgi:predicted choloylglycine hydrolase
MDKAAPPQPYRPGRAVLQGLLDLRPSLGVDRAAVSVEDAVARGLAVAKVYAFASVDYPGAAQSVVLDSDGTTAVGGFDFDPSIDKTTAFTFAGGVYQILTVPGSAFSVATGINGAGLIVGLCRPGERCAALRTMAAPSATWTSLAPARLRSSGSTMPDRWSATTSTSPASSMDS